MGRSLVRLGVTIGMALLAVGVLSTEARSAAPAILYPETAEELAGGVVEGNGLVCFWSAQGPVCVERATEIAAAGAGPERALAALLAGPTVQEQARGLWTAIPAGSLLEGVELVPGWAGGMRPGQTAVVRLRVPLESLRDLDHGTFEIIVQQIGWTLQSLGWQDLRIDTWDPISETYVPLASFLPRILPPRKEVLAAGEAGLEGASTSVGQSPVSGQGQLQGGLSGKTIYVSAGHGWLWNGDDWRTQRPSYPGPPYVGPIIEDHNNAEAVNQYLLQYLWNAGARVWPVRERDIGQGGRIINDDGPGYAGEGAWATGGFPGYDLNVAGHTYRYAMTVAGAATATATWRTPLPADGQYAVYVWYRPGSNRTSDARYTVYHAGGATTVSVDQRYHGLTWHYIGTYGFRAGEEARVTLSNQSSVAGQAVIADAVRFGGGTFDDLSGIETSAPRPPDKPWWEVAAFYHTQRMGVDAGAYSDFNDVIARPIYARWEHAGTGDDAVYVSWHTNGYDGTARGTESYVHNGEWLTRTERSLELQQAIHDELVHDIRVGWDAAWTDRGKKAQNLGELRLLWDDDPAARMPGTLIEIAFHDNPQDADVLKEPAFQMLVARAIYQGIVKYFEGRDGVDRLFLPEPPTHVAVQNAGSGRVSVSWRPAAVDTIGLAGDVATGYRVYTSTDGLGWSDGMDVRAATSHILSGLPAGRLLFVRVTAINEGGESLASETLAVRVGTGAEVLLVSGFDRLDREMLVSETDPVEGYNVRMFLDRMNRYDYVVQHGEVIGYAFDSAANEAVEAGLVSLDGYALIDWILGEESAQEEALSRAEQALLRVFLDRGGALFISGSEVGRDLGDIGGASDRAFYNSYLRADYAGDDAETYQVAPASGAIFEGVPPLRFDAPGMYDADRPDRLAPLGGAVPALAYQGGVRGTAAVQYGSGCQRLVYFGFPFETIWPDQRPVVMARVLDFLDRCFTLLQTAVVSPMDRKEYWASPPVAGLASGPYGVQKVEVAICRQADGRCWDDTGWVDGAVWLTAAGTENWTYSLPPLERGEYDLYARAWGGQGQVEAEPARVSFRLADVVFLPLVTRD